MINIKNFHKGVGASAFTGFQEIRGLNIHEKTGAIYPNFAMKNANSAGSTIADRINWMVEVSSATSYAADDSDNIYEKTSDTAWTARAGNGSSGSRGLILWKDYILAALNTGLDGYGPLSGSETWTNHLNFTDTGFAGASTVPMIVGQDGVLYGGSGGTSYTNAKIWSIEETSGKTFDANDNTTWDENMSVLNLPAGISITCLVKMGKWLVIGTKSNTNSAFAEIYFWDRVSTGWEFPIILNERGINQMVVVNNRLIIQAGDFGRFYISDGTNTNLLAQLPMTMLSGTDLLLERFIFEQGAIIVQKNKVYFGFRPGSGSNILGPIGIYSIDVTTGALNLEHTITETATERIGITALLNSTAPESFYAAWVNTTGADTYNINIVDTSNRASGDKAYFISQFYQVGTSAVPATFDRCEIRLAKPMVSGDSIKIWYRTAQNEVWTTYGDPWITENTVGFQQEVIQYENIAKQITNVKNIQFKVALNGSVELLELIMK